MSNETPSWDRVKELFQAALDRPPAERARFLREQCAPVPSQMGKASISTVTTTKIQPEVTGGADTGLNIVRAVSAG